MIYRELAELKQGLDKAAPIKVGITFSLAIARNRKSVEAELNALKEAIPEETPEFKEYTKQLNSLRRLYQEAKEAGETKQMAELNENFQKLQEDSKDLVQEREDQINKYLDQEVEVKLHKVKIADLPKDIEPELIEALRFMIEDF